MWLAAVLREHRKGSTPDWRDGAIGFVTNFFDTLGIGSFAPTTSFFKLWKLVPDEQIPGTLNVGHTIPTLVEAFIYIAVVNVDLTTLILMIGAQVAGAWSGAGIVAKWPRRWIQIGMGLALLVMAGIFLMTQLKLMPGGGDALGLDGTKLGLAVVANAMLGALMTLGIGMYGPCMILISLLGMDPKAAFPIMMGSCAFLMPVGSAFIREKALQPESRPGFDPRRNPRRTDRRLYRPRNVARHRALAGDRSGGLHRRDDAPVGRRGTPPRRRFRVAAVLLLFVI